MKDIDKETAKSFEDFLTLLGVKVDMKDTKALKALKSYQDFLDSLDTLENSFIVTGIVIFAIVGAALGAYGFVALHSLILG